MKASKYIKELKKLIEDYGDCEVVVQDYDSEFRPQGIWRASPYFWHRAKLIIDGKEVVMNCFGNEQAEEE